VAQFIYLHGFASSPRSTKAALFRERLTRRGHVVLGSGDRHEGAMAGAILDSGHELVDQLETMWVESAAFLGVGATEA
jgi:predicted esterase YcpF (UPF0227 family)